jgi:hypothetical protein
MHGARFACTHISGYGHGVKTTLEIPETVIRRAKARAAATGQTLTRLVTEALTEKLAKPTARAHRPWMRLAGAFKNDCAESHRILHRIDAEFEVFEPEHDE